MHAETHQVRGEMGTIASESEETAASAEEVRASTEEQTAGVEKMAAGAQELAAQASQLQELAGRFTLDAAPVQGGAPVVVARCRAGDWQQGATKSAKGAASPHSRTA